MHRVDGGHRRGDICLCLCLPFHPLCPSQSSPALQSRDGPGSFSPPGAVTAMAMCFPLSLMRRRYSTCWLGSSVRKPSLCSWF